MLAVNERFVLMTTMRCSRRMIRLWSTSRGFRKHIVLYQVVPHFGAAVWQRDVVRIVDNRLFSAAIAPMRGLRAVYVPQERRYLMNRIILADNQAIFRAGAARVLALEDDMRIVAQCEDGAKLFAALDALRGSVLLVSSSLHLDLHGTWWRGSGPREAGSFWSRRMRSRLPRIWLRAGRRSLPECPGNGPDGLHSPGRAGAALRAALECDDRSWRRTASARGCATG